MADDLQARLASELRHTHTIERELGGGGMSRIFRATEQALNRKVVVKVLSPTLGAAVDAERFRREIQLLAQLQHPSIVPVLTAGIAAGVPYYTMPFVDGESLRERLARERSGLPIPDAVRILGDLLQALSYAHDRGIIHRDIKPENVLLTRHHALLADFGVAKAVSDAAQGGPDALTGPGFALGTPAYMAPEQAAADPATDHRADIYAVGALAYEMLTGEPVFTGRSPQALIAAHAVQQPVALEQRRPTAPPRLASLVMHALQKLPADRPRSADEMLRELDQVLTPAGRTQTVSGATNKPRERRQRSRRSIKRYAWVGGAATAGAALVAAALLLAPAETAPPQGAPPAIAVLPFSNLSGSEEDQYLSDGISEELISALSRVAGLHIAARTSSFAFRGRNEDARTIGRTLSVDHILIGTIRRAGSRLRVSTRLTNVVTGYDLWSEIYDRELTEIFAVQEDITRSIVSALRARLGNGTAVTPPAAARPTNSEAYDLYLRGRYLLNRRGSSPAPAREHFERTVALDGDFAAAHAALAEAYWISASWGIVPVADAIPQARAAARRAVALDPGNVDALIVLAAIQCEYDRNRLDGVATFRRALALDMRLSRTHYFHSLCLFRSGLLVQALDAGRRAIELDPLNAQFAVSPARIFIAAGMADSAIALLRSAIARTPDLPSLYNNLNLAYAQKGDYESALRYRDIAKSMQDRIATELGPIYASAVRGDTAAVNEHLRIALERAPNDDSEIMAVALGYTALRDEDRAMEWLERAYALQVDHLTSVNFPAFDWLRERPAFRDFAGRYSLPTMIQGLE